MRTLKIVVITIFSLLIVEVIAVEIFLRTQSFTARDKPSWIETWFANRARSVSMPGDAKALKNPNPVGEENMAEAREHWVEHCAICHGIDGRSDTTFGRNMYPAAPNLSDAKTQQKTDGELFYIISNGVRLTGMPAFGGEDSPESIWDLVAFIRRLPQISPEEMKELQRLAGEGTVEEVQQEQAGEEEKKSADQATQPAQPKPKKKPHAHGPGSKPHKH